MWDPSSPTILRRQVPGKYFIFGHVRFASNANGYRRLAIRLNGQASGIRLASIMVPGIDTDQQELSVATYHYLGGADFVELLVTQDRGGLLDLLAPQPNLSDFGKGCIGDLRVVAPGPIDERRHRLVPAEIVAAAFRPPWRAEARRYPRTFRA